MYSTQKKTMVKGLMKKTGESLFLCSEALSESKWDRAEAVKYIDKKKGNGNEAIRNKSHKNTKHNRMRRSR